MIVIAGKVCDNAIDRYPQVFISHFVVSQFVLEYPDFSPRPFHAVTISTGYHLSGFCQEVFCFAILERPGKGDDSRLAPINMQPYGFSFLDK